MDRKIILTYDRWSVVVNVDFCAYQDGLDKLKDDLHQINIFKSLFAPTAELGHINILMYFLESRIYLFTQI